MKKKLSIRQISELSGVSVATVSRVINQNGRFSKETEERVRAVINEFDYVPNMVARGLRRNSSPIVGIIVPDITNEFFAKIVLTLQMKLFEHAYSAVICNTNELIELERSHLSFLRAQNVSGLIFISGNPNHDVSGTARPTVYIDRKPRGIDLKNEIIIESDNEKGGYLAARELLQRGCRRLAAIIDQRSHTAGQDRYAGFVRALQEAGMKADPALLSPLTAVGFEEGRQGLLKLMDRGVSFDGVFCGTDWLAMGAISALEERGITVPEQVKVAGFDDISIAAFSSKPLTTVHQQTERMGTLAVEMLLRRMRGESVSNCHQVLDVTLIRRATT